MPGRLDRVARTRTDHDPPRTTEAGFFIGRVFRRYVLFAREEPTIIAVQKLQFLRKERKVPARTDVPKYTAPPMIDLPDRQWPSKTITKSPIWCSVDLRDGNQALPNPMTPAQKLEYFRILCKIGLKHIEIAFPSGSQDDFDFARKLIEDNLIPDDVFVMGLTQCRAHLIDRTFEALQGLKRGILHAYCATSDLHMEQVFGLSRAKTLEMAVKSIRQVRELADAMRGSDIRLEFSPEECTDTDLNFAVDICHAVFEAWGKATVEKPLILNLPRRSNAARRTTTPT